MAKKIKDEAGRVYVEKKPFYKKWWVILLVVVVFVGAFAGGGDKETEPSNSSTTASKVETKQEEAAPSETTDDSKTGYGIGDAITFDGEAVITVTKVAYTDERNEFADETPEKVLVVNYDIDNLSDKDYVIGGEVNLYVDGKKANTYPVAVTLETISAGRSYEGATQAFAITAEGDYELEIKPTWSWKAKEVVMPITVD